jgi:hypothetical protein
MALKDRITLTDSGFLFDHTSGVTFTLNHTGAFIMRELLEEKDAESILTEVLRKYELEEREARFEIEQFVTQVKKYSLL